MRKFVQTYHRCESNVACSAPTEYVFFRDSILVLEGSCCWILPEKFVLSVVTWLGDTVLGRSVPEPQRTRSGMPTLSRRAVICDRVFHS